MGNGVTCTPVVTGCNLAGTFAMLTEIDIEWDLVPFIPNQPPVILAGSATTSSYTLRRHTVNGNTLEMESRACGGTSPDLCSPLFGVAVTQVTDNAMFDLPTMPVDEFSMTLPAASAREPGDPFLGPVEVSMLGLTLASPTTRPWPTVYTDPVITWLDHDDDGFPGITSDLPTTGTSPSCGMPYGPLPIPANLNQSATTVFNGTRAVSQLDGVISGDCNTISGDVIGPNAGQPTVEGRIVGCLKVNAEGAPLGECTPAETLSLDESASTEGTQITGSRFTMIRVADNADCGDVRALFE
jgi:hypothetical protein